MREIGWKSLRESKKQYLQHAREPKLAEIFSEISSYLAIQEIPFKPQAYQRAAEALEVFRIMFNQFIDRKDWLD